MAATQSCIKSARFSSPALGDKKCAPVFVFLKFLIANAGKSLCFAAKRDFINPLAAPFADVLDFERMICPMSQPWFRAAAIKCIIDESVTPIPSTCTKGVRKTNAANKLNGLPID